MLTPRQFEITQLVARGLSNKAIAAETGLAVETVKEHVRDAAQRIPGDGRARYKLMVWFFCLEQDEDAA